MQFALLVFAQVVDHCSNGIPCQRDRSNMSAQWSGEPKWTRAQWNLWYEKRWADKEVNKRVATTVTATNTPFAGHDQLIPGLHTHDDKRDNDQDFRDYDSYKSHQYPGDNDEQPYEPCQLPIGAYQPIPKPASYFSYDCHEDYPAAQFDHYNEQAEPAEPVNEPAEPAEQAEHQEPAEQVQLKQQHLHYDMYEEPPNKLQQPMQQHYRQQYHYDYRAQPDDIASNASDCYGQAKHKGNKQLMVDQQQQQQQQPPQHQLTLETRKWLDSPSSSHKDPAPQQQQVHPPPAQPTTPALWCAEVQVVLSECLAGHITADEAQSIIVRMAQHL